VQNLGSSRLQKGLICFGLGLVTFSAFAPALTHDFLGYDDQQYVTENARAQAGLTWAGVKWAFTTFYASNWHPVAWLSHMLDCQLYGLHPAGHHLTNVLLHTANTVLLFLVLSQLKGAVWRSAAVAALFGWHPLHVESVAWVAERKDVLSALFWMLTIWAYWKYRESKFTDQKSTVHGPQSTVVVWYGLALVFFALGLMSKSMVVTLPFVLLLLDFWGQRIRETEVQPGQAIRVWARLVAEKIPFFALSAVGCVLTVLAQAQGHTIVSEGALPPGVRIAHALLSWTHYVVAMILPRHLAAYYPYKENPPLWMIAGAGMLLALISVVAWWQAARRPYLAVGWFWYLGTLVPVIGLVQVGDQAWADRYSYMPLIGLFIVVVWGAAEVAGKVKIQEPRTKIQGGSKVQAPNDAKPGARAEMLVGMSVVVGLGLLAGTWHQLRYWKNTRTLFEHAAAVTHNNGRAMTVLGSLLAAEGKLEPAMALYSRALQLKPYDPEAHFLLGNALEQQGKLSEALAEYGQALWFKPLQERTHLAMGAVLAKQKDYAAAAAHYRAALATNPESATAENNLARVLHTQGRLDEAIKHYSAAAKLEPKLAQAHNNLGVVLLQKGRAAEGEAQLREAIRLRPGDAEAEYNLALALNQEGKWKEAAEIFSRLAPARPNDANLHYQFGLALAHLKKTREAMAHYAHALLAQPDFPEALAGLSWILATDPLAEYRNGTEAVRMAERACELTGRKQANMLATLAAAYAESGRFQEAAVTAEQGANVDGNTKEMTAKCQRMMEGFKAGQPWREGNEEVK
jgi:tetratricopeptide (TPR) repeat protein